MKKRKGYTDKDLLSCGGGLLHVRRMLAGLEHEDDCPALNKKMCECGKALAMEQVSAARRAQIDLRGRIKGALFMLQLNPILLDDIRKMLEGPK